MKKFAYLFWDSLNRQSTVGALKKIHDQKRAFENSGYKVDLFNCSYCKCCLQLNDIHNIYLYETPKPKFWYFLNEHMMSKKVIAALQKKQYDFIYVRDCGYRRGLFNSLRNIAPVYVEIQTNLLSELKLGTRHTRYKYLIEKLQNRRYLKYINGKICVTNEIMEIEKAKNPNIPCYMLGNGIDTSQEELIPFMDNGIIDLFFMGSPRVQWHGLERVVRSLDYYENNARFRFHIIGYEEEEIKYKPNDKTIFKFYGYISNEKEINDILKTADIAVGTMALYEKNMNEAAPLKVRKYLASGIPVVIAYRDVDLKKGLEYAHLVENNDSYIDFKEIETFYEETKGDEIRRKIREFAINNLDWTSKIRDLVSFIENI